MSRVRVRAAAATLAAAALVVGLAACAPDGSVDLGLPEEATTEPTEEPTTGGPGSGSTCNPDVMPPSYEPGGTPAELLAGASVAEIRERGVLVVGVSADTLLMSARNPFTGEIEGFDVDILREVSRAIFDDPDRLQFRVITSGQRLEVLESGEVDLVARTFTITCARWESIAFSAEYYAAGQKVLVAESSDAQGLEDLGGQRICAPAGTTTLDRLEQEYPDVEAVPAPTHSQCLALFQQGQVDGITGDDTILAGFAEQDPYAVVVGDAISAEPYGIGVSLDRPDLVELVNAVLEQIVADGTWAELYTRWLGVLGEAPTPPTPVYGRVP